MKQSEIKDLSAAQLQENLSQAKKTYADLKLAHAISPEGTRSTTKRSTTYSFKERKSSVQDCDRDGFKKRKT